jgi:hypothetical protein
MEEKAERVGSAGDEDMRVNDGIEGAAFAVIDGDRQTAAFFTAASISRSLFPLPKAAT